MISLTSPVETRAHGWPAGAKLAALCAATMVLFAADGLVFHIAACATVLALYAAPGAVFLRAGLRRLRVLWPFLVIIALWHLITQSPVQGAVIALRLLTAVGLANLVTMTTRLSDMIAVVRWLATPLRRLGLNTAALEISIALVIRFTPALAAKGAQLAQSWRARSQRRLGWRIILPFALLAIDDADHVAEALRARGGV
ncbi:energy-coupling factor transporter transmembrane protein EcfT [Pseudohalocynthiibacter aestuariivivens]|uniref:Energy-coupling factor transporter transmembrane protein EcfT n=1 Tax=Roseovarius pelagicus TaxID=2980108 RepID=A0ABY6DED6_9RHOB|nr:MULTISPECIES: energy-coupling factor transporter transmembrane component T [Rhodobacterales]QIE45868.1 energy-coupling factor transporter transmembrane protein EcfT [Pseudohalocynthiibacter aestuariivivens]UXX82175.1 energy-coupling factor transporter transmembrane protein EcfT [Roseovarius pelagicus]